MGSRTDYVITKPSTYCLQRTTFYLLPTTYYLQLTTYYLKLNTYHLLPSTCCLLLTTYNVLPTTYYLLLTTNFLLHTTFLLPTTFYLLPTLQAKRWSTWSSHSAPWWWTLPRSWRRRWRRWSCRRRRQAGLRCRSGWGHRRDPPAYYKGRGPSPCWPQCRQTQSRGKWLWWAQRDLEAMS